MVACDPGEVGSGMRRFARAASWTLGHSAGGKGQAMERSIQRRRGPAPVLLPPRGWRRPIADGDIRPDQACKEVISHTRKCKTNPKCRY